MANNFNKKIEVSLTGKDQLSASIQKIDKAVGSFAWRIPRLQKSLQGLNLGTNDFGGQVDKSKTALLQLSRVTQNFNPVMLKASDATIEAAGGMGAFTASLQKSAMKVAVMTSAVRGLVTGITIGLFNSFTKAASGIKDYMREGAQIAGKFQEMELTSLAVGRSMGFTEEAVRSATSAIEDAGIRYDVAALTTTQLIKNQIDLTDATKLATAAQGAAILMQEDSSATLQRMTQAIASGSSMVLKNLGISKTFKQMEQERAEEIGKTTEQLTQQEIMQARVNGVIAESASLMDVYTAAQESPT